MLKQKIKTNQAGILLYGLTPPKFGTDEQTALNLAQKQLSRLQNSEIDGLVIYDLQDESNRNLTKRTFEFEPYHAT